MARRIFFLQGFFTYYHSKPVFAKLQLTCVLIGPILKCMSKSKYSIWKYAAIPTLIVIFLAIYPQLNIWLVKGSAWNGAYVVSNYDEVAYSAYVNSLIDGRPRKNDPFLGQDNIPGETLYSIQLIPAYTVALPAKALGLSASTAFVVLNFLIAIFSSLAIFALLRVVTKDDLLSGIGVIAVLCLGTAIAFQGELQHLILGNYLCDFFPFLRRYQPGFAFPIFFVFSISVWKMFRAESTRSAILCTIFSGALLGVLVFSYFYLWTAAVTWFGCFTLLLLIGRKEDRIGIIFRAVAVWLFGLAAIIPYFIMLSNRPQNMDDTQLLSYTRMPDLFLLPEVIGFLLVAVIVILIKKRKLNFSSPEVLLTLSLAITPFVLFNQQIITGRSLQPVHYEIFIANYLLLISVMLLIWLVMRSYESAALMLKFRRGLIYFGLAAAIWGFIESTATATRNAGYESLRDDAMPVLKYLHEQENSDGQSNGRYPTIVSTNLMVADYIPTVTSYRSLWNPHTNSAGGVNLTENKELFYRYLYYSGYDEKDVAKAMDENLYELMAALFGGGRALSALDGNAKPISRSEMEDEIKNYGKFRSEFNRAKASDPELSYIIVPTTAEPNFQKLDQWYQRDEGKEFGLFKLYKLRLKP